MNGYAVARAAGVSRTVVSMVINGRADRYGIACGTQERVRAVIRQTGYTPNRFLRDMFLKRREILGVGSDGTTAASTGRGPLLDIGLRGEAPTQSGDPAGRLLLALEQGDRSATRLRALLGIEHRPTFRENYLGPALADGLF